MIKQITTLLFIALALNGCTLLPKAQLSENPQQVQRFEQHRFEIAQLEHWQFSGRFSLSAENENWTGVIVWNQKNGEFNMRISGPFGASGIRVYGNDNLATIQLSEKEKFVDPDVDDLLQRHLNIKLPLSKLRYWVLGMPIPQKSIVGGSLTEDAFLATLTQVGWAIEFKRYISPDQKHHVPNKIFLDNGDYQLKLVINSWHIYES